jgi:uncharacterized protein involved in type VI secretion and phage assembly
VVITTQQPRQSLAENSAGQQDTIGRQTVCDRPGFVDFGHRSNARTASRQRMNHRRGRPQYIDDDRHSARERPARDPLGQEMNLQLALTDRPTRRNHAIVSYVSEFSIGMIHQSSRRREPQAVTSGSI